LHASCFYRVNNHVVDLGPSIIALDGQPVLVLVLVREFLADRCGTAEFDGVAVIFKVVKAGENF